MEALSHCAQKRERVRTTPVMGTFTGGGPVERDDCSIYFCKIGVVKALSHSFFALKQRL
jgi:hypothetical protein